MLHRLFFVCLFLWEWALLGKAGWAPGKVEDKRFLARPVAFFLLSLSHPIVDRRADPSFNPSLKRPPRKNWYKLGVKYQRKVKQAGGQIYKQCKRHNGPKASSTMTHSTSSKQKVVTWICEIVTWICQSCHIYFRSLSIKAKMKFDLDFDFRWLALRTQCLGFVVPLAIFFSKRS